MPITLPDDHQLVTITFKLGAASSEALIVFGTVAVDPAADATLIKLATETYLMPQMADSCVLSSVKIIGNVSAVYSKGESFSGQNGGVHEASCPPQVSFLARKITTAIGRSGTGRMYLPGPLDDETSNSGIISPTKFTDFQDALDDWFPQLPDMVIFHRDPADPSDYTFAAPTPVTGLALENIVATQRRRLDR